MQQYPGKSTGKGVAVGRILLLDKAEASVEAQSITNCDAELARFKAAKEKAATQLKALYDKALRELGEDNAAIFDVHLMMLNDESYNRSISDIICNNRLCAEYAVSESGRRFALMLASMDDDYLKERSADIEDISGRLVNILRGREDTAALSEPVILMADDLSPSDTMHFGSEKLLAIVTRCGSVNSHTSILARTMNIPAVSGIDIDKRWNGRQAIVNGSKGLVIIDPDEAAISEAMLAKQRDMEYRQTLMELKGCPAVTKSGRRIKLYANIGGLKDVKAALMNDAEGIGLFRSESLYLESDRLPDEEKQFEAYKSVVLAMEGRPVIIRTLDLGADKQVPYLKLKHEDNPALGCRAIRLCLMRPDIFLPQLRAILRASAFGKVSVMFPMITSLNEVLECRRYLSEAKASLKQEGLAFDEDIKTGIMIETPAAALISDILAKEVDFFSIGTNDLAQYTLATDRQDHKLEKYYDTSHPAVTGLIRMTVENAHRAGIPAGICGEMAADTSLTRLFAECGIDELSVAGSEILKLKKAIMDTD